VQRLRALYRRWHWPVGWWRARGHATIDIGGQRLRFADVAGSSHEWWAKSARRRAWEQPVVAAFATAVKPGDVVYDVGAWIGAYALLAARLAGPTGRVFAFEPDPVARRQLERNIELNGLQTIEVVPLALTSSAGSAWLSGGASEARVGETGEVEVQTISLPDFIARSGKPPDVMKVDVEGGELDLDTGALRDVATLFIEVHVPVFRARGADPDAFLEEVAGSRGVDRLEGDADNYNVRITGAASP
jgi:FkbM family methyltransferase